MRRLEQVVLTLYPKREKEETLPLEVIDLLASKGWVLYSTLYTYRETPVRSIQLTVDKPAAKKPDEELPDLSVLG